MEETKQHLASTVFIHSI